MTQFTEAATITPVRVAAGMERTTAEVVLEIVPGASHLFEEPGALHRVAELTGDWFIDHLGPPATGSHAERASRQLDGQVW